MKLSDYAKSKGIKLLLNLIEQLQSKVKGLESVNQLTSDLLEHLQLPIKCKNALNPFGCL